MFFFIFDFNMLVEFCLNKSKSLEQKKKYFLKCTLIKTKGFAYNSL